MTKLEKPVTKDWTRLSSYSHARLRSELYIGSRQPHTQNILHYTPDGPVSVEMTWVPALYTAFREVIDNALDEIVSHNSLSKGSRIDITYDPETMVFTVKDDGRGIPINWDEEEKNYAATVLLGNVNVGRNFDDSPAADGVVETQTRGMNGVGASVVNFCSEFFEVEINRDGKFFEQRFSEGENLQVTEPFISPAANPKATGTKIRYKPSAMVFKDMRLPLNFVADRVFEIALSYPSLKVFFQGKRVHPKSVEETLFPKKKPIFVEMKEQDFHARYWLVSDFGDNGSEHFSSSVNAIPSFDGGVQIEMFRRYFFSGLLSALERESKKRKLVPNRADIANGLLIYNIIQMAKPRFDSQSKSRLINEDVGKIIKKALDNEDFFKDVVKKNPEWIDAIYERCATRTMKKDDDDFKKSAKKGKKERVDKLQDAVGFDRSKCTLFLAEGDCLRDDTEIVILKNGQLESTLLKDVEVGDLALTHDNAFRPITNKWKKTSASYVIETRLGQVSTSPEHRLLTHDRNTNTFKWLAVGDLDKTVHRLVRSRVVDMSHIEEIYSVEEIDEGPYKLKIIYGNSTKYSRFELASKTHMYAVLDLEAMSFKRVAAGEIDPEKHSMMMKLP